MKTLAIPTAVCLLLVAIAAPLAADDQDPGSELPKVPPQAELDKQFEEKLSGSTMVGFFTVVGQEKANELKEDKYQITKVTKLKNDFWLFESRIQYNNNDMAMRMPLQVKWAGDTPVITLTDVLVPGLGTFSARVLIYGDEYAGTWSAKDHGGHMFGRIVKATALSTDEGAASDKAAKTDSDEDSK